MSNSRPPEEDKLQVLLARASQIQRLNAINPPLEADKVERDMRGGSGNAKSSSAAISPVAEGGIVAFAPTRTESMNRFLREVDSLFLTPMDLVGDRTFGRQALSSTPGPTHSAGILTNSGKIPASLGVDGDMSTGSAVMKYSVFYSRRLSVGIAIAAASLAVGVALVVGVVIGRTTQRLLRSADTSPQQHSAQPVASVAPIGHVPVLVSAVRYSSSSNSTKVEVSLNASTNYEVHRIPNPDRIYIDLSNAQVSPALMGKSVAVSQTFLSSVRIAQRGPALVRVTLQIKKKCDFSAQLMPAPYRLIISLGSRRSK